MVFSNPMINDAIIKSLHHMTSTTVMSVGISRVLPRLVATSSATGRALSNRRRVTARVTRSRDGDMRKRWYSAGLLRSESMLFEEVKGRRARQSFSWLLVSFAGRYEGFQPVELNERS